MSLRAWAILLASTCLAGCGGSEGAASSSQATGPGDGGPASGDDGGQGTSDGGAGDAGAGEAGHGDGGGNDAGQATTNIAHVVLVVQENHSFDSYFGRYCTAAPGSSPSCTHG
ncbi:MAG TPA: alkaline phosphatase family protein, partial [Polyangiaceae bacterium]